MPVVTPADYKQALSRFLSGVTVMSVQVQGELHGMTASAFLSVSLDPPLVLVSVAKSAKMHDLVPAAGRFAVSILSAEQQAFSNRFAGYGDAEPTWVFDETETPVLAGSLAWIDCALHAAHDAGDHTLYIGHVQKVVSFEGSPLAYYRGKYRDLATG